jgi:peroxiredoxin
MRIGIAAILAMAVMNGGHAGEFNKVLSVGDSAPVFVDLPGIDGKNHSLGKWKSKPCVVIVFTCNSCPVANAYEDRIAAIAKTYAEAADAKVAVIAINSNTIADDSMPKMIERAKKKKYAYPYLHDARQTVAKAYGVNYTPEFVVLDGDRRVAYLGALDDKNKPDDARTNYLAAAIDAVLAGKKPATGETLARGCKIRWNAVSRDP